MANVKTWADGHGVWHVRVTRSVPDPERWARNALMDEISSRESLSGLDPRVWRSPVRVPEKDTPTAIAYREWNKVLDCVD